MRASLLLNVGVVALVLGGCGGPSGTGSGGSGPGGGGSGGETSAGGSSGSTATSGGGGSGATGGSGTTGGSGGTGAGPAVCGDDVATGDEECDGTDWKGADCTLYGFSKEKGLACTADCKLDASGCEASCDGALLEEGEECDGTNLGNHDCTEFGFTDPVGAVCNSSCTGVFMGTCGATCDGAGLEEGEECDGTHLGGMTCQDFGFDNPDGLACDGCQFDTTGCTGLCNGQSLEAGEECDGLLFGGKTCADYGYANPVGLVCKADCTVDAAGCAASCGNQVQEPGETCDGSAPAGQGCTAGCTLKYTTVINEIVYNPPGNDAAANACFIEIKGDPGLDLTGYALKFINGAGGAEYVGQLKLDMQTIGAAGYFVVVEDATQLAALPAGVNGIVSSKADMQQGPDSVVLVKGAETIDALGYGVFGGADIFAGEGMSAPAATDVPNSVCRLPNGSDTNNNSVDFVLCTATPGTGNLP